ncbi:hypothetical protein ACLOJK_000627 [Asimina triloba]
MDVGILPNYVKFLQLVPIVSANPKAAYRFRRRLHSLPYAIDRPRYTLPLFSFAPALVRPDLAAPGPSVGSWLVRVCVSISVCAGCIWNESAARSSAALRLRLRQLRRASSSSDLPDRPLGCVVHPALPDPALHDLQQRRPICNACSPDLQRPSADDLHRSSSPNLYLPDLQQRSAPASAINPVRSFVCRLLEEKPISQEDDRQPTATRRPTAHRTIAAVDVRPPLVVAASRRCRPRLLPIGGASS